MTAGGGRWGGSVARIYLGIARIYLRDPGNFFY